MTAPKDVATVFADVRRVVRDIGIPYAFIGALPAIVWGRPRATTDVDLVLVADDASFGLLDERLRDAGYRKGRDVGPSDAAESLPDIAVYWSDGEPSVRLDVFVAKTPFEEEVVRRARAVDLRGEETMLAAPEACIIYKLIASRRKDLDDVDAVVDGRRAAGEQLDWEFLDRWAKAWGIEGALASVHQRWSG